jgi:hypothetical protein
MNGRTLFLMGGDIYDMAADGTATLGGSVPQDGARGYITMNGVGRRAGADRERDERLRR